MASPAAVFSAQGGYESATRFVDGITPALWAGAAAVGIGAVAALLVPGRRSSAVAAAEKAGAAGDARPLVGAEH